jgi:alpha-L-rhamnosidase
LIGTAFFAYSAGLLAKIAAALDKKEDEALYEQLADEVRTAFIRRYVTRDGLVASQTQTAYVLGLFFDLIPAQLCKNALDELVADIEKRDWHLSTGFVGTPYLLQTLTQAGRIDVAYKLLNQKSWPSWLYPVTQGATTIWERWDGWTEEKGFQDPGMNSFNHYAYGAVGAWLYATVAGIDIDPQRPGYRHILLHPRPDEHLTHAKAEYESPYGKILSYWRRDEGGFHWEIIVPPNASATAWVPCEEGTKVYESGQSAEQAEGVVLERTEAGSTVYRLASGEYHFEVKG